MRKLIFLAGLIGTTPLMAMDSAEVYLPTFKLVYSVDDIPTKVPIIDSTEYAYIGVLHRNLYPFNLVEIPSFRDFPPIGWTADTAWHRTYIIREGNFIFIGIINTKTPGTGSHSLTSGLIDLSFTNGPFPDTLTYTYSLNHMESTDTLYVEIKKAADGPSCWVPIDILTAANVTTDTTTRVVQVLPTSLSYPCGTVSDSDTVNLRFRFADNSSITLDTTAYFALYSIYVTGRRYRPTISDTLTAAQVAEYAGIVKAAFSGVPEALFSVMGVDRSVLKTKRDDKKVLILIAPLNSSLASSPEAPDAQLMVGYWDMYDTLNAIDVIYLNVAQGYADSIFGSPWDTAKVRRYLAFNYARLLAYSLDTTEAYTLYPKYVSQFNVAAKAAWITHKALKSMGDEYGFILAFGNSPARANEALYYPTITYEGRPQYDYAMAKVLLWLIHVEELAGEEAIKRAITEPDVVFLYDPYFPSSINNVINSTGSNFYDEVKTFHLKLLGANTTWAPNIPGYPRFTSDTLLNQIGYLIYTPGRDKEEKSIGSLAAAGYRLIPPMAQKVLFDGWDDNRVITYIGSTLDTIPGFFIVLVDTVNLTMDTVQLDNRMRWSRSSSGGFGNLRFLLINIGRAAMYSLTLRDTLPPTITDIGVMPSAIAPEYVDVYVNINTPTLPDTSFYYAYYDVKRPGIKFAFWPAENTDRYDTLYTILEYTGMLAGSTQVYFKSINLRFADIFGNLYYGRIMYRLLYAQNRSGLDYVAASGVSDTVGEIYRIKLTPDLQEVVPGILSMASLSGSGDLIIVPHRGQYLFSSPVSAQVIVKAEEGDRLYVFDGYEWKEADYTYYPEEGKVEAFVSSAYGIYVGKAKPSGNTVVSDFAVKGYLGHVTVYVPKASPINLRVYNTMGRLVRTTSYEARSPGKYAFSLKDLPKGVYLVRVKAGRFHGTAKVVVIGGAK